MKRLLFLLIWIPFLKAMDCETLNTQKAYDPNEEFIKHYGEFLEAVEGAKQPTEAVRQKAQDLLKSVMHEEKQRKRWQPAKGLTPRNAPWRSSYVSKSSQARICGCPLCALLVRAEQDPDREYRIHKGKGFSMFLNGNPTELCHPLLVFHQCKKSLKDIPKEDRIEFFQTAILYIKQLGTIFGFPGFRFFMNMEHPCAGASIPGHLHAQFIMHFLLDNTALARELIPLLTHAERNQLFGEFKQLKANGRLHTAYKLIQTLTQHYAETMHKNTSQPSAVKKECPVCDSAFMEIGKNKLGTIAHNQYTACSAQLDLYFKEHAQKFKDLDVAQIEELQEWFIQSIEAVRTVRGCPGFNMYATQGYQEEDKPHTHATWSVYGRSPNEMSVLAYEAGEIYVNNNLQNDYQKYKELFPGQ